MNATEYMEFFKGKSLDYSSVTGGGSKFSTGKVSTNIYMQNLGEKYILAEFASLLSGTVTISFNVTYLNQSSVDSVIDLYIEDEKSNIVHSQKYFSAIWNFEVKAGKKYKVIAIAENNGTTIRAQVNSYEITSYIVDNFKPILVKELEVSE